MTLEERLNNWARAQRGGSGGGDPLVATIYFPTVAGMSVDATLDLEDANKVEVACRKLMPLDRKVLQMHYVWRAHPAVICRRLSLKIRPKSIFDLALAHAKRAIEEKLVAPKPTYVSMQTIIDRLKEEPLAETK
jgi:hypothetical protein